MMKRRLRGHLFRWSVAALFGLAALACGGGSDGPVAGCSVEGWVCSQPVFGDQTDCETNGHTWDAVTYESVQACEAAGGTWTAAADAPGLEGEGLTEAVAEAECDCEGAICGLTACGETCGLCTDEASPLCWAGQCTNPEGCDIIGFTDPIACANDTYCTPGQQPYAQAATTPSVGGGFKVKYAATVDDYSLELDPVIDADALADGRPIAKKKIFLELNHVGQAEAGRPLTGTFQLGTDDAREDCTYCVRAGTYCSDKGCGTDYVATEGTLEITSSGEPGTPLVATLKDVRFTQVYLHQIKDDGTYKVAGQSAKIWCLGDFPIAYDVPEPTQPVSDCVTEGTGVLLGDNIKDYTIENCLGEEISLHSRCGRTKAVWVVAVAGW